jgi:hypothetical protein
MCYSIVRKRKERKTMSETRERLIDRMIKVYGFEHPVVLDFCKLCECEWMSDQALTTTVECHEEYPIEIE